MKARAGLSALTLAAIESLGEDTLVIDEGENPRYGWRMARIGDVALLENQPTTGHPSALIVSRSWSAVPAGPSSSTRLSSSTRSAASTTRGRRISS